MFSKKIILSVLPALFLVAGKIQAMDSDKLIGQITKKQGKDFCAGFGIGVTHGLVNKTLNSHVPRTETLLYFLVAEGLLYFPTYIAAEKLGSTYNGGTQNNAILWGRGVGQYLAESIVINENGLEFELSFNFSLLRSIFS